MSSVNNVGTNSPVYSINRGPRPVSAPPATTGASPTRGADKVELSGNAEVGHLLHTLKTGGDVRTDKVAQIKAQIANGTYDDDKKLSIAADRLLEDLLDG